MNFSSDHLRVDAGRAAGRIVNHREIEIRRIGRRWRRPARRRVCGQPAGLVALQRQTGEAVGVGEIDGAPSRRSGTTAGVTGLPTPASGTIASGTAWVSGLSGTAGRKRTGKGVGGVGVQRSAAGLARIEERAAPGTVAERPGRERQAVIGQDDVAEDDADIGHGLLIVVGVEKGGRNANRKGSASSCDHWISVTGSGFPTLSVNRRSRVRVATWVSRTAQRWRRSASAALPVCGPITSWKISTSPGSRFGKEPSSVASVAPLGRQQLVSPQV